MKWRVVFVRSAEKELAKLSIQIQLRVGQAIRASESDYRVLYTADHTSGVLTISAIGHRREVYR